MLDLGSWETRVPVPTSTMEVCFVALDQTQTLGMVYLTGLLWWKNGGRREQCSEPLLSPSWVEQRDINKYVQMPIQFEWKDFCAASAGDAKPGFGESSVEVKGQPATRNGYWVR